jgi:hypothetical protein
MYCANGGAAQKVPHSPRGRLAPHSSRPNQASIAPSCPSPLSLSSIHHLLGTLPVSSRQSGLCTPARLRMPRMIPLVPLRLISPLHFSGSLLPRKIIAAQAQAAWHSSTIHRPSFDRYPLRGTDGHSHPLPARRKQIMQMYKYAACPWSPTSSPSSSTSPSLSHSP